MASNRLVCPRCNSKNTVDGSCSECGLTGLHTNCGQMVESAEELFPDVFDESTEDETSGWRCNHCTLINNTTMLQCKVCMCPRDKDFGLDVYGTNLENETRLILVGRTGAGKSATANNILDEEKFRSEASCSSVTSKCRQVHGQRFNRWLQIVDTPGMFDTEKDNDTVTREIVKCVGLSAPGPHAILLIVGICRFTEEERQTIELLKKAFGPDMTKYLIVVFTRKDDLDRSGKSLDDLLRNSPPALRSVMADCNQRCIAINNIGEEAEREQEVQKLLEMVDDVVLQNGGGYFTSPIFDSAEKAMQEREKQIRQENRRHHNKSMRVIKRQEEMLRRQQRNESTKDRMPAKQDATDSLMNKKLMQLDTKMLQVLRQQSIIKSETERRLQQQKQELDNNLQHVNNQSRDIARKELEQGDTGLLKNIWSRITEAGKNLKDKFISIFVALKDKFGNHKSN